MLAHRMSPLRRMSQTRTCLAGGANSSMSARLRGSPQAVASVLLGRYTSLSFSLSVTHSLSLCLSVSLLHSLTHSLSLSHHWQLRQFCWVDTPLSLSLSLSLSLPPSLPPSLSNTLSHKIIIKVTRVIYYKSRD